MRIFFVLLLPLLAAPCIVWAADTDLVYPSSRSAESAAAAATRMNELLESSAGNLVDDYTFLRRVYFDIVGTSPTPRQIHAFVDDTSAGKRQAMVDELLDDQRYGENWGRYWSDVIMYRRSEDRALLAKPTVTKYLSDALNNGQPWDQIASSFITATGDIREQGETGIIAAQAGRPEETVAEIARIFLGVQIQCAQCHDHFTDRWTREQFHELAAFFPRTAIRPKRDGDKRSFVVVSVNREPRRKPKVDRHFGKSEHFMPDLDNPQAAGTRMTPTFFLNGEQLPLGISDMDRRSQLAEWITDDEWFSKSLVNRLWTDLVGSGFYHAVDDIGPERDCESEAALHYLAQAFVDSDFDVKWLLRTITGTKAYQSRSHSRPEDGSWAPTNNHPIRLRSDQLFNSITQLFGAGRLGEPKRKRLQRGPRALFAINFGYDPSLPQDEISGSVPQALMLMNSEIVDRQLNSRRPGGVAQAIRFAADDEKLVEYLYLRCLSRKPTPKEAVTALKHVQQSDNRVEGYQDLVWALLNSSEFMHRG